MLADFLVDHPIDLDETEIEVDLGCTSLVPWRLKFDGSRTDKKSGAGIVLTAPNEQKYEYSFQLDFECSNNQVEYEALIIGLEIILEMNAKNVEIIGNSQLIINQLAGTFKCNSWSLMPYMTTTSQLLDMFDDVVLKHRPRDFNKEANELAQLASGLKIKEEDDRRAVIVEKRILPSVKERSINFEVMAIE